MLRRTVPAGVSTEVGIAVYVTRPDIPKCRENTRFSWRQCHRAAARTSCGPVPGASNTSSGRRGRCPEVSKTPTGHHEYIAKCSTPTRSPGKRASSVYRRASITGLGSQCVFHRSRADEESLITLSVGAVTNHVIPPL